MTYLCRSLALVGLVTAWSSPAAAQFVPPSQQFPNAQTTTANEDRVYSANANLTVPADGVLLLRSLTINAGVTVTVQPNAANTPLTVVCSGAIVIDGTLDLSGQDGTAAGPGLGGPGGFPGGRAAPGSTFGPQPGFGPRSGVTWGRHGENGGYGSPLAVPLLGGSGGAGVRDDGHGGGGGGAVLLASDTSVRIGASGAVLARGGAGGPVQFPNDATSYSGAGGAIRLLAPLVDGTGQLDVTNAGATTFGGGWIRIDSFDPSAANGLQPLRATALSLGSWLIADPFQSPANPPTLQITNIQVGSFSQSVNPTGSTQVLAGPQTASDVEVTVAYAHFQNDFTVEVSLAPDYNPLSAAINSPVGTKTVRFDPATAPTNGDCVTDATGAGTCVVSLPYVSNVFMTATAVVRRF
ncbi:MAG: hypothetical protein AAFZ18_17185 [Myxococcota bacterium]